MTLSHQYPNVRPFLDHAIDKAEQRLRGLEDDVEPRRTAARPRSATRDPAAAQGHAERVPGNFLTMLICLVTVEMSDPHGQRRTWRGQPDSRDWEGLIAAKKCDGWKLLKHTRDFVEDHQDGERKDQVELTGV